MGTFRRQLISDSEICQRYRAGEPLFTIGKRAGLWSSELKALLVRNGMDLRTPEQVASLIGAKRRKHIGTLRLRPRPPE